MEKNKRITFDSKGGPDLFYIEVRKRVEEYFKSTGKSKHANGAMVFKTIFILSVFVGSYLLIITNSVGPWGLLGLAIINGFFTALIGLNIGHDAIHNSYSSNKKVNKWLGLSFNIIGANDDVWRTTHNTIHHTFTNIPDHDDDINQLPVMRMKPNQKLKKIHRFQHLYVFLIYPLASLSWVFIKDYIKFFQSKIGWFKMNLGPGKSLYRMLTYKLFYYATFIALPLIFVDLPWYYIVLGFLILHFVEGLTLALIFQLAHVVEGTHFPIVPEDGKMELSWSEHQMHTTADFSRKSPITNFICGGLNFQVEHHLFPNICHIHYRHISPIVEKTAKEFGVPFIENKTFLGAIRSHTRLLKEFGRVQVPQMGVGQAAHVAAA